MLLTFALSICASGRGPQVPLPSAAVHAPDAKPTTSSRPDGVYRVGGGVTPPKVLYHPDPEFSKEARKQKIAGDTMVKLVVDAHGDPQNIRVVRSAAERYQKPKDRAAAQTLDAKAIEAVQRYHFQPAMRDGQPVAVELNIDVNFQIF